MKSSDFLELFLVHAIMCFPCLCSWAWSFRTQEVKYRDPALATISQRTRACFCSHITYGNWLLIHRPALRTVFILLFVHYTRKEKSLDIAVFIYLLHFFFPFNLLNLESTACKIWIKNSCAIDVISMAEGLEKYGLTSYRMW